MELIKKRITCKTEITFNQEIELTKDQWNDIENLSMSECSELSEPDVYYAIDAALDKMNVFDSKGEYTEIEVEDINSDGSDND